MTEPANAPPTPPATAPVAREWWTRPRVMLPLLLACIVGIVLASPASTDARSGDARLSANIAGSLGARALRDVAERFGWRVILREAHPVPTRPPGSTVHAVLSPPLAITSAQAHLYLEAVRGGDGLLFALGERGPLSDSLGVWRSRGGGVLMTAVGDSASCRKQPLDFTPSLWPDGRAHLYGLRWIRGRHGSDITFAMVRAPGGDDDAEPVETAAGFALGKGRVVVVADPDQLRNDVLRRCHWGADVVAMQMLEWLRAGGDVPRTTLEFDEFHQGFGPRDTPTRVVGQFLGQHPVGRTLLQGMLAALVLLLAVAPRPILPRRRPRVERRDPLEQADALAHAYQQVRATRTATQRLLRGVRSRVELTGGLGRLRDDETFLADALRHDAALADDVALVRQALRSPPDGARLPDIGAALRRIEDSLTTTTTSRA